MVPMRISKLPSGLAGGKSPKTHLSLWPPQGTLNEALMVLDSGYVGRAKSVVGMSPPESGLHVLLATPLRAAGLRGFDLVPGSMARLIIFPNSNRSCCTPAIGQPVRIRSTKATEGFRVYLEGRGT